jgi:phosphatidylserine decarboxylase
LAKRIVSYLHVGDEKNQGEVIGLIKFGSQVSIIFDSQVEVVAQVGDTVIDGETILAKVKS